MKFSIGFCRAAAAAIALAALSGCAALTPATPEQAVEKRSEARWKALVAGDFKQAYEYLAPSYRAITPFEKYRSSIGGAAIWVNAEVIRVECVTDKCTSRVKIEAQPIVSMHFKGNITTGADETWLLEDGQWWLFQKL